jgi:uncharacterized protein (UPF0335 family)
MVKKAKTQTTVDTAPISVGGNSAKVLKQYIEQIESLEDEKQVIGDHIKDVFTVAKSNGFDTKTMREILKQRKITASEAERKRALFETYARALGMLPD